jgi:membrane-associated phospholipid phosphatase
MTKKNFYIGLGTFLSIFVILLIIVTVNNGQLDYALSKLLVTTLKPNARYAETLFGRFFEAFGESPIYLLVQLGFVVFACLLFKRKQKALVILVEVAFLLVGACAGFACLHRIEVYFCRYYAPDSEWSHMFSLLPFIVNFISGASITIVLFLLIKKPIAKINEKHLISYFLMGFTAVLVGLVLVNIIMKPIFNRVRYRGINMNESLVFSPWYVINKVPDILGNNIKDDFTSFPSGHSAAGAVTYLIIFLPFYFDSLKTKKGYIVCTVVPIVLTTTVCISRIVMGAHYLSDVLFGSSIVFVSFWIFYFIERKITNHGPFVSENFGNLTIY